MHRRHISAIKFAITTSFQVLQFRTHDNSIFHYLADRYWEQIDILHIPSKCRQPHMLMAATLLLGCLLKPSNWDLITVYVLGAATSLVQTMRLL